MPKTPKTPETTTVSSSLEHHLLAIRNAFRQHQNDIRRRYKISANEMEIILFVSENGPQRMKSIGETFKIKFSTLTSLVDKIERLGLVKRVNSKEDRRSILVTVTRKGQKMLEEYDKQILSLAQRITDQANGKGVDQIIHSLEMVSPLVQFETAPLEEETTES